ncbi:MAG: hypothetical protein J6D10_10025, partial [Clostridia bacterium]|nr:hypothetical protein [Clostridia bacterium]
FDKQLLTVDVHNPDVVISVEVREKCYIYSDSNKGHRGLPVGCSGKGLLLLSGGLDSPVAGYRMMRRGMKVESISGTIQILDYIRGDTNDDSIITSADAIYLLRYTLLPERYPLSGGDADYNGDGTVNADDAVYLLYHVMIPERFPIES